MSYQLTSESAFFACLNHACESLGNRAAYVTKESDGNPAILYFLSDDTTSGFALVPHAERYTELRYVFSSGKGELVNIMWSVFEVSSLAGNDRIVLECFAPLVPVYSRYGFKSLDQSPWCDEYMPEDWNTETMGKPSYHYMKASIPAHVSIAA